MMARRAYLCFSLCVGSVRDRELSRMPSRPDLCFTLSCMALFVKFTDVIYIQSAGGKGEELDEVGGILVGEVRFVLQA